MYNYLPEALILSRVGVVSMLTDAPARGDKLLPATSLRRFPGIENRNPQGCKILDVMRHDREFVF